MRDLNSLTTLAGFEPEHHGSRRDRVAVRCGGQVVTWGQPKTYAGKLSHRELREPYWANRTARVS